MNSRDTVAIIREQLSSSAGWAIEDVDPLHFSRRSYSRHLTCRVRLTDGTERLVFVKFVSGVSKDRSRLEELVVGDNAVSAHLHRALRTSHHFAVPRPLAYSREHLMLISEQVNGTRLQDKIARNARLFPTRRDTAELEADCFRSGEWLRRFQEETRAFSPARTTPGRDDLLDAPGLLRLLVGRVEKLRVSRVLNEQEANRLISFAQTASRAAAMGESTISGVHGDFFPGNLLVDGKRVIGIDFVMFRRGSIFLDPTYFIFQLETLASQILFRRAVIQRLQQAFLDGYDPALRTTDFWNRSPLFELLFLMHATGRLDSLASAPRRGAIRRLLVVASLRMLRIRLARHVQTMRPDAEH